MIAAQETAAEKQIQITAGMFGSMAGLAKGYFNQNSKDYKNLMRLEQTFRTIELALATKNFIQKMLFTETETAAVIAGEAGKQAA